ncbi:hypothetical protein COU80_02275 [Candidatus Peregrinibacteria bacterium CG10_big_fil_rev_8_21_14_0_10_55_24]|nr:MAG: hypothetical protein COU80_02275 [Candidatus Peregrinibacteria bacterium CG10_big_fil_rev_8_21_14_0_10_55_24]
MIHPERISYVFLGTYVTSIFCLQWWQCARYPRIAWILLSVVALHACTARKLRGPVLATCLGIGLAFLSVARVTHVPNPTTIDWYADQGKVTILGTIVEEPDRRPMQTKYTVAVRELTTASGITITGLTGRVLASDHSGWPQYRYGDEMIIRGALEKPTPIDTFRYDHYLARFDVQSIMAWAATEGTGQWRGNVLFATLYTTKERFEQQINRIYSEPHASFLAGLLTGSRRGIPEHLTEDFNRSGLTHIIAISGYNITIVITVIGGLLFWLPLKWRLLPAVTAIVLFAVFVGASAAVVRASIMGILGLIALQSERVPQMRLMILWTLAIMLAANPMMLWYDVGFQFSFLAVIGLAELSPILEPLFSRIPKILSIREALLATVAAQIAVVPLAAVTFGRLSLIAPLANMLAIPAIPIAMLLGFTGILLSFLWFPLGQLFAFIGWAFLEWVIVVAKTLSALPGAAIPIPVLSASIVCVYYGCLISVVLLTIHRRTLWTSQNAWGQGLPVLPGAQEARTHGR